MNRATRRRTATIDTVKAAVEGTASQVNGTLAGFAQKSGMALVQTLEAWGVQHVEPMKRRVNVAVGVAVLALVVAVVGLFV